MWRSWLAASARLKTELAAMRNALDLFTAADPQRQLHAALVSELAHRREAAEAIGRLTAEVAESERP